MMLAAEKCLTYWLLATILVVCLARNCAGQGCPPAPIYCEGKGPGEMRWGKRALTDIGRNSVGDQMARPRRTYSESQLSSPKYRFRELLRRFTRTENH